MNSHDFSLKLYSFCFRLTTTRTATPTNLQITFLQNGKSKRSNNVQLDRLCTSGLIVIKIKIDESFRALKFEMLKSSGNKRVKPN